MEMPQRPYIFNVYLLISTAAYNALFLIPASRIPFQSCHLHAASISTLPITPFSLSLSPPFILAQISLFWRGLLCKHYRATNDAACSLTFIALHSITTLFSLLFHVENSTLLPDGAYPGALHESRITLSSFRLMLAGVHPHTRLLCVLLSYSVYRYVVPECAFSRNRLSLLSSIVANVYRDALLARHWI